MGDVIARNTENRRRSLFTEGLQTPFRLPQPRLPSPGFDRHPTPLRSISDGWEIDPHCPADIACRHAVKPHRAFDIDRHPTPLLEPDPKFELGVLVPGLGAVCELLQFRVSPTCDERNAHVAVAACTGREQKKGRGRRDPGNKPTRHARDFRRETTSLKRKRRPAVMLHNPPMHITPDSAFDRIPPSLERTRTNSYSSGCYNSFIDNFRPSAPNRSVTFVRAIAFGLTAPAQPARQSPARG